MTASSSYYPTSFELVHQSDNEYNMKMHYTYFWNPQELQVGFQTKDYGTSFPGEIDHIISQYTGAGMQFKLIPVST